MGSCKSWLAAQANCRSASLDRVSSNVRSATRLSNSLLIRRMRRAFLHIEGQFGALARSDSEKYERLVRELNISAG